MHFAAPEVGPLASWGVSNPGSVGDTVCLAALDLNTIDILGFRDKQTKKFRVIAT